MRRRRVAVAAAVAVVTTAVGYAVGGSPSAGALGPGLLRVEIDVEHSRFSIEELHVEPGTTVEIVLRNHDPIAHELLVGGDDVHDRHRRGDEAVHPPVPGEVSVGPLEDGLTFYEFDEPGTFTFACHLPRHLAYGMEGRVVVG